MHVTRHGSGLEDALRLHYQPIIQLGDGQICRVEVLARTMEPGGRLLGPQGIVEAMSDPDIALSLTRAIMERALAEYEAYGLAAHELPLAFNLPLNVLVYPGISQRIETVRRRNGIPAALLQFELTETQPVKDPGLTASSISALRDAGYGLALDDVIPSTPYLTALMEAPVSAVKLDRSVVTEDSPESEDFVRQIVLLAKTRQLTVVAEGIEKPEQRDRMQGYGATHGQGFLFSRPLAVQALAERLNAEPRVWSSKLKP